MIYITRHGETEFNRLHKVMGRCDEPLNETGIKQAKVVKDEVADFPIDLIISSPLSRSTKTAEIINEERNIPIIIDNRIIERDFGEFEGLERKDFGFKDYWDYYKNLSYDQAENIQAFFQRVYAFLDDITVKYKDKNIFLSAHAGISIPVACYFSGIIPNGSLVDAGIVLENCQVATYENPAFYGESARKPK